jgi:uncharacterized membrane protein HdeD (DUF308 family)
MLNTRTFRPIEFLRRTDGLATLEWVVLASAVILLGIGVIILLQPRATTAASTVGSKLVSSVNSNS